MSLSSPRMVPLLGNKLRNSLFVCKNCGVTKSHNHFNIFNQDLPITTKYIAVSRCETCCKLGYISWGDVPELFPVEFYDKDGWYIGQQSYFYTYDNCGNKLKYREELKYGFTMIDTGNPMTLASAPGFR